MIENRQAAADKLRQQAVEFGCDTVNVIQTDAFAFLQQPDSSYDLIFVDPPFKLNLYEKVCQLLIDSGCLQKTALVYLESDGNIPVLAEFEIYKQSRAGAVNFVLLKSCEEKSEKQ